MLVALSDHGFGTFRRAFHTNTWLWQNGLLSLKDNRKPSEELGEGFAEVDWSKTYAYALGLGGAYLNFKDRERGKFCKRAARRSAYAGQSRMA